MESDSTYYETTYSEDERYEQYRREKARRQLEKARQLEEKRKADFAEYYKVKKNKEDSIFNLRGLNFVRFTNESIKFSFEPCKIAKYVSKRIKFFVSLRYRKGHWLLKRDSIPANYKLFIYSLFYTDGSFRFRDIDIPSGIYEIWEILKRWAKKEHEFRKDKFKRYQNGEDVYIDRDDEDIFLNAEQIKELHDKRKAIWARMLPPGETIRPRRRLRRRIISPLSSSSSTS